jgi:hypothetical protein
MGEVMKYNWKTILQYVALISAIFYFWVAGFYWLLERRAEAACIQEEFTGAHLSGLVVYCEMVYEGTSYIVPLTHIKKLHELVHQNDL